MRIQFFICSLAIHCTLFWLFFQEGSVEYGVAPNQNNPAPASPSFRARIVSDKDAVLSISQVLTETRPHAARKLPIPAGEVGKAAEPHPQPILHQDYLTAGSLTRLPVPLTDIDLNVAGINDLDVIGTIELIVLIDAMGIVDNVTPMIETAGARVLTERVAQIFRDTRFTPGEINGAAVKSQLRITVISETLAPPALGLKADF